MRIPTFLRKCRLEVLRAWFRILPLQQNKIIFWANSFKQYGCSPKYITEHLLSEYPGRFKIIWVFEHGVELPADLPEEVKTVHFFSTTYLRHLHTAHFIICNMRMGDAYRWKKRIGQKYIQTWHSSLRLKKIEKDAEGTLDPSYIEAAKHDSAQTDLVLSGCVFSTQIFSKSFWYTGKILPCGTPRCDLFFHDHANIRQRVLKALGLESDSRMILYAPTFRKEKDASIHDLDSSSLVRAAEARFGGKWEIVYRMHPNILQALPAGSVGHDASRYHDMQELIAAADMLITDYSSCMFDMAVAGKPCLLFCPDLEEYMTCERGLYFKLEELPFPLARTNSELAKAISVFDKEVYVKHIDEFLKLTGSYEKGHASEEVARYIMENL